MALLLPAAVAPAYASDSPTINVSDSTGKVEDMIDVSISLANNPGITSMRLTVGYDEAAVRLVKTTDKGVLGISTFYPGPDSSSPYILFWVNGTATTNFTPNGDIAIMRFEILKDIGSTSITVSYDLDKYDILNAADQKVEFAVKNGIVTITSPEGSGNGTAAGSNTDTSGGLGDSETSANPGSSGDDTSADLNEETDAADAAEVSGGDDIYTVNGAGSPLANILAGKFMPWWTWIIIAAIAIIIVVFVIVKRSKQMKEKSDKEI
jgi:hypothetical protein